MRAHLIVVVLLVLAMIPAPATADVEVRMDSVVTDVREEVWQDEPTVDGVAGDDLPATPFPQGVYRNPYFNASHSHRGSLGHYLAVKFTLPSVSSDRTSQEAASYLITAEIEVPSQGNVEAKVTKQSPNEFLAEFDLDGSVAEDVPALPPGAFDLVVEVHRTSTDPIQGSQLVGMDTYRITNDPGRTVTAFDSLFPTQFLRKWRGLGGLKHVPMTAQVGTDASVPAGFNFPASSNVSAAVSAYVATRHSPQGPGPTGDAGEVLVSREVLHAEATSRAGTIRTQLTPADVLGDKPGDVLVVAGYLSGDDLDVGASLLVIPASDATAGITDYTPVELGGPTGDQTDGFEATIEDESGGSSSVDAVALHPSGTLITGARSVRSSTGQDGVYFANFAYDPIRRSPATDYRIVSLLYRSTPEDTHALHAIAEAGRGFTYSAPFTLQAPAEESVDIPVSIRSAYGNGDGQQDLGFRMEATVSVTGLPGGGNFSKVVLANESETVGLDVPFRAFSPGSYPLTLNISTPDVQAGQTITVTVPDGRTPISVPGFPTAASLVVLAAVAVWLARRR